MAEIVPMGFNRPLGAETVKRTGIENLAGFHLSQIVAE